MIGRRGVLLAGAAIATGGAVQGLPIPPGDALAFRLIRHDTEIGRHTLAFDLRGDTLTVRIAVEARVTVLSIPVVHYTHRVTETWEGGALSAITGDTDKNGRTEWVRARRTADGLLVQGSHTREYIAPEQAIGTSYWNKRMLDGPMISMEDGVLLRPKVTQLPPDKVPAAAGAPIPASHYNLSGSFNVDVWYDTANVWASLGVTAVDGSETRYERL